MLLSNRRAVLLGLAALAGCGFEPVHGTRGTANNLRDQIRVDDPANRNEFQLIEQFELRMGRPTDARYGLAVDLTISEQGLAITGSNNVTRFNVLGKATFALRDLASGEVVLSDNVNTFTSYSASSQPVATLQAEKDAKRRLMIALADKIVAQLLINSGQL